MELLYISRNTGINLCTVLVLLVFLLVIVSSCSYKYVVDQKKIVPVRQIFSFVGSDMCQN